MVIRETAEKADSFYKKEPNCKKPIKNRTGCIKLRFQKVNISARSDTVLFFVSNISKIQKNPRNLIFSAENSPEKVVLGVH